MPRTTPARAPFDRNRSRSSRIAGLVASTLLAVLALLATPAVGQEPAPEPGVTTATSAPTDEVAPDPGAPATTVPPAEEPSTTTTAPAPTTTERTATSRATGRPTLPDALPDVLREAGVTEDQYGDLRSSFASQLPCGADPGAVCVQVLDWTGSELLAESLQWVVDVPLLVLVILAIALVLNRVVRRAINRHLTRLIARSQEAKEADPTNVQRGILRMATASSILGSTATVVIFSIAGLIALSELGINLGPMLAGAGIAGIAIGFGAQNLVRDVLAGLFVIIEDQYGVGDVIDAGKASGVVEEFSLRVTKVRDVEGTLWFVPNGVISEVGNKTQLWSRAILDIEVAYQADHHKAAQLIKDAADRLWREARPGARIIEEPELWGVERLGESGVAIRLAVKSAPADQWRVARLLRAEIKDALDAGGIEIPFPQRTIWIRNDDSGPQQPLQTGQ